MVKKLSLFLFASLLNISNVSAQMRWNSIYQSYIDQYKNLAIEEMLRYNIPASITLAQGIFESSAGRSDLTVKGNNHFGIKCHGWGGNTIYHDDDERNECFRAYDNAKQSYEDHSKFLSQNTRYRSLFSLQRTDYRSWARGLKACGYATNPVYADKLIELIELYKLYELDRAEHYDKFMAKRGGYDKPITQEKIGKEVDLSYRKIAKYNERNKNDVLQPGEVIYLKKKQKHADKAYKGRPHIVKPNDSMYSIAQFYGIRLKSLYKMNHLSPDYQLRVGDVLKVY